MKEINFTIQSQFEYSDACFPAKMKHDEAKQGLVKALETDRQVNGEFSIFNEILGEGTTGIVFKGMCNENKQQLVTSEIEINRLY